MNTEAETGATGPRAKERLGTPGAAGGGGDPPLDPSAGGWPCDIVISEFWPPELAGNAQNVSGLKLPSLGLVTQQPRGG